MENSKKNSIIVNPRDNHGFTFMMTKSARDSPRLGYSLACLADMIRKMRMLHARRKFTSGQVLQ